ncbi:MAG: substrate-binding domain-containing protein [Opitutales bacterium]
MSWLDQIKRIASPLPELKKFHLRSAEFFFVLLLLAIALIYWFWPARPPEALLNVAFDASQPVFEQIDAAWQEQSGKFASSLHAGSVHQSRALAKGLVADTICVTSAWELDSLAQNGRRGLVAANWRDQFPNQASPFHSTVVFLVRKRVEGRLQDWSDLFNTGLRYALPAPDVSGGGQYAYLALARSAELRFGKNEWLFSGLLDHAAFLPYGARRCTKAFLEDQNLDALLTWESEALRVVQDPDNQEFALIYPTTLIRIDVVVAIAEAQTKQRGSRENAEDYLHFLFSERARGAIEAAGFRPNLPGSASAPGGEATPIEALFDNWPEAREQHLAPSGTFHRLMAYREARAGGSE